MLLIKIRKHVYPGAFYYKSGILVCIHFINMFSDGIRQPIDLKSEHFGSFIPFELLLRKHAHVIYRFFMPMPM